MRLKDQRAWMRQTMKTIKNINEREIQIITTIINEMKQRATTTIHERYVNNVITLT